MKAAIGWLIIVVAGLVLCSAIQTSVIWAQRGTMQSMHNTMVSQSDRISSLENRVSDVVDENGRLGSKLKTVENAYGDLSDHVFGTP